MVKLRMISVHCIGAEGSTNQIDRIREGLLSLQGIVMAEHHTEADLIYINNPWYDQVLSPGFAKVGAKKIFNVLDVPEHLFPEYPLGRLKHQLTSADKVTCISNTVASQLKRILNINASVIYNPVKDVNYTGVKSINYKYLYVGRACDKNKRFHLVEQAMNRLGAKASELAVCGAENPNYGSYLGVVSDKMLEELYNSVQYVFLPSRFEGIGLSMIEGAICGAIPLITNDNLTGKEFFADGRYDEVFPTGESIANFVKKLEGNWKLKENFQQDVFGIGQLDFKNRFNKKSVAQNIIDIYHTL